MSSWQETEFSSFSLSSSPVFWDLWSTTDKGPNLRELYILWEWVGPSIKEWIS